MLFTSITLPEDARLVNVLGCERVDDGARVDARPPARRRLELPRRR